jgi:hypothetical protein
MLHLIQFHSYIFIFLVEEFKTKVPRNGNNASPWRSHSKYKIHQTNIDHILTQDVLKYANR